jgi:hypothetical protein
MISRRAMLRTSFATVVGTSACRSASAHLASAGAPGELIYSVPSQNGLVRADLTGKVIDVHFDQDDDKAEFTGLALSPLDNSVLFATTRAEVPEIWKISLGDWSKETFPIQAQVKNDRRANVAGQKQKAVTERLRKLQVYGDYLYAIDVSINGLRRRRVSPRIENDWDKTFDRIANLTDPRGFCLHTDGFLYVAPIRESKESSKVYCFDPVTQEQRAVIDTSSQNNGLAADIEDVISVGTVLLIACAGLDRVLRYNTALKSWKPSIKASRNGMCLAIGGDTLYLGPFTEGLFAGPIRGGEMKKLADGGWRYLVYHQLE